MKKVHELGKTSKGEFDEVFIGNAFVHIERMADRCFWMAFDPPKRSGLPRLSITTGVENGEWWFRVSQDQVGVPDMVVKRPACYSKKHSKKIIREEQGEA